METRAIAAVSLITRSLSCPSCNAPLSDPHRAAACGDVVCASCAADARRHSRCPVPQCNLPVRPAEVLPDSHIASLVAAVANLRTFAAASLSKPRNCPVRLRVRPTTETKFVRLTLRVRATAPRRPRSQRPIPPQSLRVRLRLRPPATTAKRKRTPNEPPEPLPPTQCTQACHGYNSSNGDPRGLDSASKVQCSALGPTNSHANTSSIPPSTRQVKSPRPLPDKTALSGTNESSADTLAVNGDDCQPGIRASIDNDECLVNGKPRPGASPAQTDANFVRVPNNSSPVGPTRNGSATHSKVSPVTSENKEATTTPQHHAHHGSLTPQASWEENSLVDRLSTQTDGNLKICLTGLSKDKHHTELAEEMIASLGGEIIHDFCTSGSPYCLITLLDDSRNIKSRTMLVHEALARRVPIVSIGWLMASFKHGAWAQTGPFEAATNHREDGKGVFHQVLASFDNAFSREDASILVRKAGEDMHRIVHAGGAVVADMQRAADIIAKDDRFVLHIHITCDFGENSSAVGPQVSGDDMELLRSPKHSVATRVVSMPWISDCLFSGRCPPPSNEKSESMSAFSEYTASEGGITHTPPE